MTTFGFLDLKPSTKFVVILKLTAQLTPCYFLVSLEWSMVFLCNSQLCLIFIIFEKQKVSFIN